MKAAILPEIEEQLWLWAADFADRRLARSLLTPPRGCPPALTAILVTVGEVLATPLTSIGAQTQLFSTSLLGRERTG